MNYKEYTTSMRVFCVPRPEDWNKDDSDKR